MGVHLCLSSVWRQECHTSGSRISLSEDLTNYVNNYPSGLPVAQLQFALVVDLLNQIDEHLRPE
jgi:hypothetical protein